MIWKSLRILSILALALLSAQMAYAKAIGLISLSGPFLEGEVEITNPQDFETIVDFVMKEWNYPDRIPPTVGPDSYLIKLGVTDGDGKVMSVMLLRYTPGLNGRPGALYYEDSLNGSSEAEGDWFTLDPAREKAFQNVLNKFGIGFAPDGRAVYSESYKARAQTAINPEAGRVMVRRESNLSASAPVIEPRMPDQPVLTVIVAALCLMAALTGAQRAKRAQTLS